VLCCVLVGQNAGSASLPDLCSTVSSPPPRASRTVMRNFPAKATACRLGQFTLLRTDGPVAVGYAIGKNVGKAVVRNRVRRRLREAIAEGVDPVWIDGTFLVVAHPHSASMSYSEMRRKMRSGFRELHERAQSGK